MRAVRMAVPYSDAELAGACADLCRANGFRHDVHLVIVAYFGMGPGFDTLGLTDETGVYITGVAKPRSPGFEHGIDVAISSPGRTPGPEHLADHARKGQVRSRSA
jgi:branched-chain amino acid aminotransferase